MKLPAVSKDIAEELFGAIRKGMHGDFGLGDNVTGNRNPMNPFQN